jgi:hypothetical protein
VPTIAHASVGDIIVPSTNFFNPLPHLAGHRFSNIAGETAEVEIASDTTPVGYLPPAGTDNFRHINAADSTFAGDKSPVDWEGETAWETGPLTDKNLMQCHARVKSSLNAAMMTSLSSAREPTNAL